MRKIVRELKRRFDGERVDKIVTIEASGIAIATLLGERVLIVDDFMAEGQAAHALIDIVHQAGAEVVGIGIAIEKGQQQGGRMLREEGYHLESIAIVESMDPESQTITFRQTL